MTTLRSIAMDVKVDRAQTQEAAPKEMISDAAGLHAYTWYVIGLLTLVSVFSYVDRMALAALAPSIQRELNLSDSQLGLLTGLAFSLFYAIAASLSPGGQIVAFAETFSRLLSPHGVS